MLCRIIKRHDEAVHCLAFTPDSNILLTACSLGNIRLSYMDTESEGLMDSHIWLIELMIFDCFFILKDPDCWIDAAHDMGVLSADFCSLYHTDRTYIQFI